MKQILIFLFIGVAGIVSAQTPTLIYTNQGSMLSNDARLTVGTMQSSDSGKFQMSNGPGNPISWQSAPNAPASNSFLDTVTTNKTLTTPTPSFHVTLLDSAVNMVDTLVHPSGAQNGQQWFFRITQVGDTAVLYCATGFNGKGTPGTLTFTPATGASTKGEGCELIAIKNSWYLGSTEDVTVQ